MKKKGPGKRKKPSKAGLFIYIFVLLVAFSASGGLSYLYLKEKFAFESPIIEELESGYDMSFEREEDMDQMRLYRAGDDESPNGRETVTRKDATLVIVEDITRKNIRPYGVRLLDLYLDRKGMVYIDLSDDIKKNFRGDAREELRIIAGLYQEIKEAVPELRALKILIEGREAESFGGHIDISRPIGEEIAEIM